MLFEAAPYVTLANTPGEPSVFEIEEKKSRFIGRACHVENEEQAREFVARVRALEHGARHNVFAFLACGVLRMRVRFPWSAKATMGNRRKLLACQCLKSFAARS